jgi:hypothetical protein
MSEAIHTPGPWTVEFKSFGRGVIQAGEIRDARDNVVTHIGVTDESGIADARLIAAAPELLAALEKLLNATNDIESLSGCSERDLASKAIAKAYKG